MTTRKKVPAEPPPGPTPGEQASTRAFAAQLADLWVKKAKRDLHERHRGATP